MTVSLLAGCGAEPAADTEETPVISVIESGSQVSIVNSYDNTEELIKRFPVINPTPVDTPLEEAIQNRLLTGFENWNRGYDAWKAWGDILYTPESMYNVHGVRMTLEEYQQSQNMGLKAADIQMGNFNNMIICDDWCAIRYDITSTNRETEETSEGSVMEFVQFKDYGDELGVRVVEGWAGTKGADFDMMRSFLTEEEAAAQDEAMEELEAYVVPEMDNLEEKYPVLYPTAVSDEKGEQIKSAVLSDFEMWNQGSESWADWADSYYSSDLQYHVKDDVLTLDEYKEAVCASAEETEVERLYFNNLLISGDWAALHYQVVNTNLATGERTTNNVMQFLHFEVNGDDVKVTECWTK